MERNKGKNTLTFALGIILIGCLIQAAGWIKNDRLVFPDVISILRAFFRLLLTPHTWVLIRTTLLHLLSALALSSVLGITIGLAEGFSDFIRNLLKPLMIMLRSIPMIVLVVIIMVLTKYDRVPLIATSLILIPLISEAACEGCKDGCPAQNAEKPPVDLYEASVPVEEDEPEETPSNALDESDGPDGDAL